MLEKLLTVDQAAALLHISPQTLYRKVWAREISYIDIGSGPYIKARFKPEHIEDYLASREVSRYS